MIDILKELFGAGQNIPKEILPEDNKKRIQISVCVLLLELAYCDSEFSDKERKHIIEVLTKRFILTHEESEKLIQAAREEQKERTDLWHFTNVINKNYSIEEKIKLIEEMWRIVFADKKLDKHENYIIHKLSELLKLRHSELIDAKMKVKKEIDKL